METDLQNILIFATDIKTESEKQQISNCLDNHLEISKWTIDQEDIDCVLRIESDTLCEEQIIHLISQHNFLCTILE
ncbi:hypothetical protein [Flavobacterium sp.]|uniref:hypothetical protein n=1 Tax=Flavobacterium sp. TaxID=239 RepID=UPI002C79FC71|nr:hypothetical protein [Flavobacterium sp.]HSD05620.1 hypothetical protein [Flavobacterium sp.]